MEKILKSKIERYPQILQDKFDYTPDQDIKVRMI